jgi:hypothetical protein
MAKLSTILDQIDAGSMLLPEFQRGYVWNRDQVRGLMKSLYHGYPVGALLVWETEGSGQAVRGGAALAGQKQLLLDGQQRVTTLYGIVRGRAPSFFEGDPEAFGGLRFNVEEEAFQFHAPVKMKGDPRWVDVSTLFVEGPSATYALLAAHPDTRGRFAEYVDRVMKLRNILERVFHVEAITGADKTIDVVVDIFNRVNSGGTKLSKGDLALAQICSEWGDARPTMRRNLDRWRDAGYQFTPDWLLRNVNAVATGRAPFSALEDVSASGFRDALNETLHHVDHFLSELAIGRLGLDHDRVLMGRYAIPVISRHLHNRADGRFADGAEADKALYWYVHAALRGRFAGSTETFLAKDLETVDKSGIDGVIAALARTRKGNLSIDAQDFEGVGRGSRSYPLLYLLARVTNARDLATGRPLGQTASAVGVHEIFPKQALAKAGYSRAEVNAIANFSFLTPSSAVSLTGLDPAAYLGSIDSHVLRSQWIPDDPKLWQLENYPQFIAVRRELLASAANEFLDELLAGTRPWERLEQIAISPEADGSDARAAQIAALVDELVGMGYAKPALDAEIADPETGRPLAVAEAFWSDGLQPGQGSPVVLELDPDEADLARLTELGCEVFTSVDALRGFVQRRNEVASGERDDEAGVAGADPGPTHSEGGEHGDTTGPFDRAVLELVERCRAELRYNPRYFRVMITQYGALGATRRLLGAPAVSDGFVTLWERQRLDLAVETLVLDERFAHLFSDDEREIARRRLRDFGHDPAAA